MTSIQEPGSLIPSAGSTIIRHPSSRSFCHGCGLRIRSLSPERLKAPAILAIGTFGPFEPRFLRKSNMKLYNCISEDEQINWAVNHLKRGGRLHDIALC